MRTSSLEPSILTATGAGSAPRSPPTLERASGLSRQAWEEGPGR